MKAFERTVEDEVPTLIKKLEGLADKDNLKLKSLHKIQGMIQDLQNKFSTHKSEFLLNLKLKDSPTHKDLHLSVIR